MVAKKGWVFNKKFAYTLESRGIAGLTYALKVAEYGKVAVVTKDSANEGCTQYAQGGVCAVLDKADSVESHIQDTMVAGGFLNIPEAVDAVCREGPAAVLALAELGAEFTRNQDGSLHLTREGGHTNRRIVHAADATGREISRALVAAAHVHPNIHLFEHHLASDLVWDEVSGARHCLGADVLDQQNYAMTRFVAPVTMLATGGAGQVYPNTTNPSVCSGDGMAMAYRGKAAMANMEFVQFHPTAFCDGRQRPGPTFLISEAVRGEGGLLFNQAGERFMLDYDSRMELAPRDVVARSIHDQMMRRNESHVLLDISHCPKDNILSHFPNIAARCRMAGIDITQAAIPVAPAQHYMCGGVQTGLLGETSIAGLYACGEVACTGLHGANRLASNSLLEGLVFAERAVGPSVAHAEYVTKQAGSALRYAASHAHFVGATAPRRLSTVAGEWVRHKRREMGQVMWSAGGIVRRTPDMKAALQQLAGLYVEVKAMRESCGISTELVELRNLVTVAELIMASALQRKESRGLHYCVDYPHALDNERHATVISTSLRRRHDLARYPLANHMLPVPARSSSSPLSSPQVEKRGRARELSLRSHPRPSA
ncbi:hypothetical protein WJX72_001545 [[Myrmecia] bisecta]|uniref:L-aspartate oxidase n=1 Tax=[Myrmecia] bisecta TaxID=41462 RepID=A0AAW1PKT8_9CHLO